MNFTVPYLLFACPVLVVILFRIFPGPKALVTSFVAGWLFLPMATIDLGVYRDYTKGTAICLGVLIHLFIFDSRRLFSFRPRWIDLPILVWCLCPFVSGVANDLDMASGLSDTRTEIISWGLPYFLGRIYLADARGLRMVVVGILVGTLVYIPLCLFEARMSPVLHSWIYGYHQHEWSQAKRDGGWRPTVFMQHGLAVSFWMAVGSLTAFWLWLSGAMKEFLRIPLLGWTILLTGTTLLCHSLGAVVLLLIGAGALVAIRWSRRSLVMVALISIPSAYIGLRATGSMTGEGLVEAATWVSLERAESLDYRLRAENALVTHALRRPLLGWGGWGRNLPSTEEGGGRATDGLWVITLGKVGMVGLVSMVFVLVAPVLVMCAKVPGPRWRDPAAAYAVIISMVLVLFLMDSLMNDMRNPVFLLGAGGLAGALGIAPAARHSSQMPAPEPRPLGSGQAGSAGPA